MKIRKGFVSNSSSSSFVTVFKKEDYDKFISELPDYMKQAFNILENEGIIEDTKIFGVPCVCYGDLVANDYSYTFEEEHISFEGFDEETQEEIIQDLMKKYEYSREKAENEADYFISTREILEELDSNIPVVFSWSM